MILRCRFVRNLGSHDIPWFDISWILVEPWIIWHLNQLSCRIADADSVHLELSEAWRFWRSCRAEAEPIMKRLPYAATCCHRNKRGDRWWTGDNWWTGGLAVVQTRVAFNACKWFCSLVLLFRNPPRVLEKVRTLMGSTVCSPEAQLLPPINSSNMSKYIHIVSHSYIHILYSCFPLKQSIWLWRGPAQVRNAVVADTSMDRWTSNIPTKAIVSVSFEGFALGPDFDPSLCGRNISQKLDKLAGRFSAMPSRMRCQGSCTALKYRFGSRWRVAPEQWCVSVWWRGKAIDPHH